MPSVGEIIREHREEILARWESQARGAASARGLAQPELRNILPIYLEALVQAPDTSVDDPVELIERHVSSRIREGFRLDEIVDEVAILARAITAAWSDLLPADRPSASDIARLEAELHRATTAVASSFAQHMANDEQLEKRYLRRLQAITSEASDGGATGVPLGARLIEALELVMEALGAQTAALLLFEPEHGTLTTAASAGLAHEALERVVVSVDGASFAARLAVREQQPLLIDDAKTTALEIDPALRQSGIHALLGVRLPARRRLVGVMYVGLSSQRSFTPSEVRRLETLGEQLTLHLDNAQLFAELRRRVADLETERALRERFISALSHDLRGPLTVARASAQLLERDAPSLESHAELPTRIVRSIDRADRMVRDLLDALLIRAGRPLPLQVEAGDLAEITRTVAEELVRMHGPRFVVEGEPEVRGYWSGEDVRRAIWNLATNAVKYGTADAPVTLTVRRCDDHVDVAVHNEGAPIPSEDQARLFTPFAQLGQATPAAGRHGWGLGLTLVRGCAEAHGGSVDVVSAPGRGTSFTLHLPLDARPFVART